MTKHRNFILLNISGIKHLGTDMLCNVLFELSLIKPIPIIEQLIGIKTKKSNPNNDNKEEFQTLYKSIFQNV